MTAATMTSPLVWAGELPVAHVALLGQATAEELQAWVAERAEAADGS